MWGHEKQDQAADCLAVHAFVRDLNRVHLVLVLTGLDPNEGLPLFTFQNGFRSRLSR